MADVGVDIPGEEARDRSQRPARPSVRGAFGKPRFGMPQVLSKLGIKVLALNFSIMFAIIFVFLAVDETREKLIESRLDGLEVQSELIARSFAGETLVAETDTKLNPDAALVHMRQMDLPPEIRVRIYFPSGQLVADSRLIGESQVTSFELAPIGKEGGLFNPAEAAYDFLDRMFLRSDFESYVERANQSGLAYPEVLAAIDAENGNPQEMKRYNAEGSLVLGYAVPIRRLKGVLGVLLLTTEGDDIDQVIRKKTITTFTLVGSVLILAFAGSLLFSLYIVRPIHRLAETAEEAIQGTNFVRVEIPDLSGRRDEIGDLSVVFRRMVRALYTRIEAIESFAADVSHEIKNPLTSIRSAVETLELVKDDKAKEKLMKLIIQDVGRLDRLISDISDASRLDAELVREKAEGIDMAPFLEGLQQIYESTRREEEPHVELKVEPMNRVAGGTYVVRGLEGRLGQVFRNIINNAVSFSSPEDTITVRLKHHYHKGRQMVAVMIEDEGPGIPEDNLESIFKRFYTERPESEGFGGNSGLGLSISRQIIEMFDGEIWAENCEEGEQGARFIVVLPQWRGDNESGRSS